MKYKLRIKQSLKNFDSYVPDEIDFLFRLNANESPFDETQSIIENLSAKTKKKFLYVANFFRTFFMERNYVKSTFFKNKKWKIAT